MINQEAQQAGEEGMIVIRPLGEKGNERWTPIFRADPEAMVRAITKAIITQGDLSSTKRFFRQAEASLLRQILGPEAAKNLPSINPDRYENETPLRERDEDSRGEKALRLSPERPDDERRCSRT